MIIIALNMIAEAEFMAMTLPQTIIQKPTRDTTDMPTITLLV